MRIAHVREESAPAGAPWRLAAALDGSAAEVPEPDHWLDLEVARRRAVAARPALAHDHVLFRQPITTLDDHLGRSLRVAALADLVEGFEPRSESDDAVLEAADLRFGPPILRPSSFRDFYAFEQHVRTMWRRRGGEIPEAWYRLPVFYLSNTSELRGPGDPVAAPHGSSELDFELEVGALVDTPALDLDPDRAGEAIGGFFVLNDWSARDLQRDEMALMMGPAKGKDFATSIGPWLTTPDELADVGSGKGYDLAMTSAVGDVPITSGRWSDVHYSFGEMLSRAAADVHVRAGEILGSGTVGTGCLLEAREATLGRYLQPGDEVRLTIERLGTLAAPVVASPHR